MDYETKMAYDLPGKWQTQRLIPVFKAEGCAVYIGEHKITSNLHNSRTWPTRTFITPFSFVVCMVLWYRTVVVVVLAR